MAAQPKRRTGLVVPIRSPAGAESAGAVQTTFAADVQTVRGSPRAIAPSPDQNDAAAQIVTADAAPQLIALEPACPGSTPGNTNQRDETGDTEKACRTRGND